GRAGPPSRPVPLAAEPHRLRGRASSAPRVVAGVPEALPRLRPGRAAGTAPSPLTLDQPAGDERGPTGAVDLAEKLADPLLGDHRILVLAEHVLERHLAGPPPVRVPDPPRGVTRPLRPDSNPVELLVGGVLPQPSGRAAQPLILRRRRRREALSITESRRLLELAEERAVARRVERGEERVKGPLGLHLPQAGARPRRGRL